MCCFREGDRIKEVLFRLTMRQAFWGGDEAVSIFEGGTDEPRSLFSAVICVPAPSVGCVEVTFKYTRMRNVTLMSCSSGCIGNTRKTGLVFRVFGESFVN